jgi:hypothetical protein
MTNYLESAAALVKKMADENEANTKYDSTRVECVKLYALLGAIEKGLMPSAVAEEIYGQLRSKDGA